jgi:hypothetical protein
MRGSRGDPSRKPLYGTVDPNLRLARIWKLVPGQSGDALGPVRLESLLLR